MEYLPIQCPFALLNVQTLQPKLRFTMCGCGRTCFPDEEISKYKLRLLNNINWQLKVDNIY